MAGISFAGCPETFQESQQPGVSTRVQDKHQKIRRFRQGDIIAIPAGVPHWCYNDGNEPVVAVSVLDVHNGANQLDMNPRVRDQIPLSIYEIPTKFKVVG